MSSRITTAMLSIVTSATIAIAEQEKPFVIMLNGTTSCGKTSISWALANLSSKPMLMTGCDKCWAMIPRSRLADWFEFVPGKDEEGKETAHWIPTPQLGQRLYDAAPKIARLLVEQGFNVIVDEVLLDNRALQLYLNELKGVPVYLVGVHCSLRTLEEREKLRCDRPIGLARRQLPLVHNFVPNYDFEISTEHKEPSDCAKEILTFVEQNQPRIFDQCRQKLESANTLTNRLIDTDGTDAISSQNPQELREGAPVTITPAGKEGKPTQSSHFPSF